MAQDTPDTSPNDPGDDTVVASTPVPETQYPPDAVYGPKWWVPYVLPFLVYMLVGVFEPPPPDPTVLELAKEDEAMAEYWKEGKETTFVEWLGIEYEDYPVVYSIKIGLTVLTMLIMLPAYLKFPFRISWLAVLVGVVGVVLWISLCWLHLEPKVLGPMGLMKVEDLGERPGFNPFKELADQPTWEYTFLAIRFLGLALVVPIIEEFFLRGWLIRYVMHPDWWKIPFGYANFLGIAVATGVPMLMHPGELVAAAVWFSMVTWLMLRTKNIWDCVAAHVVTNLLLGIYVVSFGQWQLW